MSESISVNTLIPIPLTTKELTSYADQAAQFMEQLDVKEEEYKGVQSKWRGELKELRLQMRKFLQAYRAKEEERNVECEQHFCLKSGDTWYEYEGKEYMRRAMDEYEKQKVKQGNLFNDGSNLPADSEVVHSDAEDNHANPPALEAVQ